VTTPERRDSSAGNRRDPCLAHVGRAAARWRRSIQRPKETKSAQGNLLDFGIDSTAERQLSATWLYGRSWPN